MSDKELLRPLVDKVIGLASRPKEEMKKELWARHNALLPTDKIPVCVTYEGMPAPQWDLVFGRHHLRCEKSLARHIEFHLKRRIWVAEHVPEDHVVWAAIPVSAVSAQGRDWGVKLAYRRPAEELGAKQVIPPFADKIEPSRLRAPSTDVDQQATASRLNEAAELVEGRLGVYPIYPGMGNSPFEYAVRMRGMENLFLDVYDSAELVHEMMDFITSAMVADHKRREEQGWINCPADPSRCYQMVPIFRHIAAYLAPGFERRKPLLVDEWAYVSAQSASELSPGAFVEFVHRYNSRLADFFSNRTVYYHGCECLDHKLGSIASLPNLRRHHVSPWSSVQLAAAKYQGRVNLEVHAHPGRVFFGASPEDMRKELVGLVAPAKGHPMSLNLSDIHSLNGNPDTLRVWAEIAQDVVSG